MVSELVLFGLAVLGLLATPGPTNTLLATAGAIAGFRRSLHLLVGELGGYLIAILAARLLLGPVIHAYPAIGLGLKLAVSAYLVVTAIGLWRSGGRVEAAGRAVSLRAVFIATLLNPKALIFAFGIFPAEHAQLWVFFMLFAVCVPTVGGIWIAAGRALGAAVGQGRENVVRRVASMALVGFAALIVASAFG